MEEEEIDDEVCAIMQDHGPDGHVDGHDLLTAMCVRRLSEERAVWLRRILAFKEYLTAAADGSMSRNNSKALAAELLREFEA